MLARYEKEIGRFAWIMAWVGLVAGQLHALARFRTADGQEDLELPLTRAWAEPADDLLSPLLGWADPDLVYITYGKIWLPVFVAFTLCAMAVYRRRKPAGFESGCGAWPSAPTVWPASESPWTTGHSGQAATTAAASRRGSSRLVGSADRSRTRGTLLLSTVLGVTLLVKRFRPCFPASPGADNSRGLRDPDGHLDGERGVASQCSRSRCSGDAWPTTWSPRRSSSCQQPSVDRWWA